MRIRSTLIDAILALPLCASLIDAQTPGTLAEGSYGVQASATQKEVALHWQMTEGSNGGFLTESTQTLEPNQAKLIQGFGFTKDWKPTLYSIMALPKGSPEPSTSIVCHYLPASIACDVVQRGKRTDASLHVTGPRLFLPPGFKTDMFWIMATACAQAARVPGRITNVAEVSIADDSTESVLNLEIAESLDVEYVGQEDLKIVLGTIRARKFRIAKTTVWTADSGLLLAMTSEGGDSEKRIELLSLSDPGHLLLVPPSENHR